MKLDEIVEKIKRLENGGNGTNLTYFLVAFDFLYFIKDNDNRERFIHEYYKNDNGMFSSNFKKICIYSESILIEDTIYENMLKSLDMDIKRDEIVDMYNYYDAIDRIEKANISAKNLISDGFKIRLLKLVFDKSNDDYNKLSTKVSDLKKRYDRNIIDIITIIALFIAITIGMVSGISFTMQAFNNVTEQNIFVICLTSLIVGFVIFNLFFGIFKFVSKLADKDVDTKGHFMFIDLAFVVLIIFFIFLIV